MAATGKRWGAKNMRLLRTRDAFKLLALGAIFVSRPRLCQDLAVLFLNHRLLLSRLSQSILPEQAHPMSAESQ